MGQKEAGFCCVIGSNRGAALLMVLWILAVLIIIVLSFSVLTRTESLSLIFFREEKEKQFLAEAGIQRGIVEIMRRAVYKNKQLVAADDGAPANVDGTQYTDTLTNGTYVYSIFDESGKIDLNGLTDKSGVVLSNLLVSQGVSREQADTIVDSILDWKDTDELVRLQGAESNYYMSLPNPYRAKNANFETVEEVLLVKGMTAEILYNGKDKRAIFDFLTVYSGATGINLNAAPGEVLAALPGATPNLIETILLLRQKILQDTGAVSDVRSLLADAFSVLAPFAGTSGSNVYSIESTGYRKDQGAGFVVKAVVVIDGDGGYRYLHYKSPGGLAKPRDKEAHKNP
jgi:general secretion pathway protein K